MATETELAVVTDQGIKYIISHWSHSEQEQCIIQSSNGTYTFIPGAVMDKASEAWQQHQAPLQEAKKPSPKEISWQLYMTTFDAFGAWMKANSKAPIGDPEGIRLARQAEACRNAWLACGGTEQVVIGASASKKTK